MKIALISFHNAYNYGACLQAYALEKAVDSLGAESEYINYNNKTITETYQIRSRLIRSLKKRDVKGVIRNILGAPLAWSRIHKFKTFYKENLKITEKKYFSSKELEEIENDYDKFISGGDQIWNDELTGSDSAYFLDFIKNRNLKISYSSSFGMIKCDDENRLSPLLNDFCCISTRERSGVEIIEKLTGRKAHLVLDPVFLADKSAWERNIPGKKSESTYAFIYLNDDFNVSDYEKTTNHKIKNKHILSASVSIKDFIKPGQKITFSMSPDEFLKEIRDAELVLTTSFHCLAFSIILHKPFIAILSGKALPHRGKDGSRAFFRRKDLP